ncbi:MAG: hypothetical protein COW00_15450 [Bdellovibrio sp. CG12_big_fil_rev_8_21_14_0_65_39_13]|nr:MAG: hypothetical protein COW78_07575 [Bdellovibrio sp. CG22_combo_CG10-13_8_21_14_all_39_27]PIQ58513.1 MAG: hypothetical protein COW00_15450 [Bdellovibrio sp. CG12_big_fil_rev_8_21_14_0_65_39_13]PIR35465.1 MAG: hypothetical protein COV37_08270 [Bdellovibrio sp. CG11_big_fil_rev_8_21_14_0_20_39_38]PJB53893.1 MAG: hypothetical protein CO099_04595 [Bdellovibrio sp. CG_4_9_14_3_um_filter_39_7]
MKFLNLALFLSIAVMTTAQAKVKMNSMNFNRDGQIGRIEIGLEQDLDRTPELEIRDGFIQVSLFDAFVWPKMEKKVSIQNSMDTTLSAYQFDNNSVRFRAYVPGGKDLNKNKVTLRMKDKAIWLEFPISGKIESAKAVPAVSRAPALDPASRKGNSEKYDESYLKKLLADKDNLNMELDKSKFVGQTDSAKNVMADAEDKVNVAQAATEKVQGFSLAGYAAKFVAFLALFIVILYGAVSFLKKGVLGKTKLGFLNSTKAVEVMSTTYVGPKRSMILVRAHKQVFLVGSSESGLQLISEVNDLPGVIKEGEKSLAGDNFDSSYSQAETTEKEFNLKTVLDAPAENQEIKETVKLSDQIKTKIKNLKPLQ